MRAVSAFGFPWVATSVERSFADPFFSPSIEKRCPVLFFVDCTTALLGLETTHAVLGYMYVSMSSTYPYESTITGEEILIIAFIPRYLLSALVNTHQGVAYIKARNPNRTIRFARSDTYLEI